MQRRCRRAPLYQPRTVDEESLMLYLDSLAACDVPYPSYELILSILPRMTTLVKLNSPLPSAELCGAAIGDALVELHAGPQIPLSELRRQLDADVLATVSQQLATIAESVHVGFTTETRPDGSRYLFTVYFDSEEVHATEIQSRLLNHRLVQSKFAPIHAAEDIGILDPGRKESSPGIQSGNAVYPIEDSVGSEVCLGSELKLEFGTIGPFVWHFDPKDDSCGA
jgi:hypothetical protein